MNASELKYQHEAHNPGSYMFDRNTMKFFGDTMRNFYVPAQTVTIKGRECYEMRRRRPVKNGLQSSFYFDVVAFERVIG